MFYTAMIDDTAEQIMAPYFNAKESAATRNTEIFQTKAAVLKKIWTTFDELRDALKKKLDGQNFLVSERLDTAKGQIAKGDNHRSLPFVFMDMPQLFLGEEFCTYRSFFWWGNGLVFALILSGPHLGEYRSRLLRDYAYYRNKHLHLAVSRTPWEWERGAGKTIALTTANRSRIRAALGRLAFIKLERFIPLTDPVFRQNRIIAAGLETFDHLKPLILR